MSTSMETTVVRDLKALRFRLDFDDSACLDIARVDEETEISERLLGDARAAMAEFILDRRPWSLLTGDERRRIVDRAIRYAVSAEWDANESARMARFY